MRETRVVSALLAGALVLVVLAWLGMRPESEPPPPNRTGDRGRALDAVPVTAPGVMTYIYNAPESPLDRRYDYHWEILRLALERTQGKWGPYALVPSVGMSEQRQTTELRAASGRISVMYLGTTPVLEQSLVPVRIPVDKNLGSYSVYLVRPDKLPRFAAVQTLDDLRHLTVGLGLGWLDVDILRANRFEVVTGSNYDGLFRMAANGRFDGFLRAAVEVLGELEARGSEGLDLVIEDSLLLYYPLPMYFWFSDTSAGRRLAARAREGMFGMIEDGTYDRIFTEYQGYKIAQLKLKQRRLFKIPNPYLVPETPFDDGRLWFDPMQAP
jgi:ABC-type amino acid transport substrate-binding protein